MPAALRSVFMHRWSIQGCSWGVCSRARGRPAGPVSSPHSGGGSEPPAAANSFSGAPARSAYLVILTFVRIPLIITLVVKVIWQFTFTPQLILPAMHHWHLTWDPQQTIPSPSTVFIQSCATALFSMSLSKSVSVHSGGVSRYCLQTILRKW